MKLDLLPRCHRTRCIDFVGPPVKTVIRRCFLSYLTIPIGTFCLLHKTVPAQPCGHPHMLIPINFRPFVFPDKNDLYILLVGWQMAKLHRRTQRYCGICDDELEEDDTFICLHKTRRLSHGMCADHMRVQLLIFLQEQYSKIRPTETIQCCGNVRTKHRDRVCSQQVRILGSQKRTLVEKQLLQFIKQDEELYRWYRRILAKMSPYAEICLFCSEAVVEIPIDQIHLICPYCSKDWCRKCLMSPYHEGGICSPREMLTVLYSGPGGADIRRRVESGEIRLCPGCNSLTQKAIGCNHITCKQCDTHWCWLCQTKIDSHNPYAHFNMDTGTTDCRGRLYE